VSLNNQPIKDLTNWVYNDDITWWSLAYFRGFEVTGINDYLNRSITVWNVITEREWDSVCGGGVWWSTAKTYKNAITNSLFLELSTRLAMKFPQETKYIQWAIREYDWYISTGMLNNRWLINDGIDLKTCKNNNGIEWTYNQGVFIGGLSNLYFITRNQTYLDSALKIANATIQNLVYPDGILKEHCEPSGNCGSDAPQFKGIFLRYLLYLVQTCGNWIPPSQIAYFKSFVDLNANSVWKEDRLFSKNLNYFGLVWKGPLIQQSIETQTSAFDLFNTFLYLNQRKI